MSPLSNSAVSSDAVKAPFWAMRVEEALEILKTAPDGLSAEEAAARKRIFGPNTIRERRRLTAVKIIWRQLESPLILVLIAAGAITVFLREWIDAGVILAAVIVNTALGFGQEYKAENALELLKTYIRVRVRVRRQGREQELDAADLVPGDIVRISQGDRIPADARLLYANNLEVDEAVLTGESLPELKKTDPVPAGTLLGDRASMVFGGTLATEGLADAVITATGSGTEFGKIASLVAGRGDGPTLLQRSLGRFVMQAGLSLGAMVAVLFVIGIYSGYPLFEVFLISVAVAVSAVPEGLPVAVTVILAVGVQRLAARKGVVRKLLAAETLGSTTIILTDKTGTLTRAQMSLSEVVPYALEGEKNLLRKALLNLDVVLENPGEDVKSWRLMGRPLEVALVRGAAERGLLYSYLKEGREFLDRLPFSSEYKFSASVTHADSKTVFILFGAPDVLVRFTSLSIQEKAKIMDEINERAARGERVLGVISKEVAKDYHIPGEKAFTGLTFDGLISFRDPLRPHVADAIRRVGAAGVRTVIVTGDHPGTAEAVARELGMIDGKGAVLTGSDLKFLSREELRSRSDQVAAFARVSPEDKLMLVKLYKEKGHVVAVTGDGVNDAPALEEADIGVAVGSGTDVTKSAADLVLLDDDFSTLVAAIEEGRRIMGNIRKVIVYLLSDSLDELLLIGGALLTGLALPINALQILFVNFFSDSFPAVALAFEKGIDGLGSRPKKLHRSIFDREVKFLVLVIGVLTSALLFALYYALLGAGFMPELVRSFIFAAFATYTLLLSFSIRSLEKSIFSYNPFSNRYLVLGVLTGITLTALAVYVPFFQKIFGTVSLPFPWVMGVLGVGALNIAAVEFSKWIFRRRIL